jgi:hypothetical protein
MVSKISSFTTPLELTSAPSDANFLLNKKVYIPSDGGGRRGDYSLASCFDAPLPFRTCTSSSLADVMSAGARVGGRPTIYAACPRSGPEQMDEILELAELVMEQEDNECMLGQEAPHPTPIGLWGIKVVDTVLLEEFTSQLDEDSVAEILSSLMFLRKRKPVLAEVVAVENVSQLLERPTKKMRKSPPTTDSFDEKEDDPQFRIRSYQADLWGAKFEELAIFRKNAGHCLVPHNWANNVPLAQWVKRQRYQYKLKMKGEHSTMTAERESMLEDQLGFIWSSHDAVWEERLNETRDFRNHFGHCNVPSSYAENVKLSIWVKSQRRQYKLFRRGERKSTMTPDRIDKLTNIGFVWNPRNMELGPRQVSSDSFLGEERSSQR